MLGAKIPWRPIFPGILNNKRSNVFRWEHLYKYTQWPPHGANQKGDIGQVDVKISCHMVQAFISWLCTITRSLPLFNFVSWRAGGTWVILVTCSSFCSSFELPESLPSPHNSMHALSIISSKWTWRWMVAKSALCKWGWPFHHKTDSKALYLHLNIEGLFFTDRLPFYIFVTTW